MEERIIHVEKVEIPDSMLFLDRKRLRLLYHVHRGHGHTELKGNMRPGFITRHKRSSTNDNFLHQRVMQSTLNLISNMGFPYSGGYKSHFAELAIRLLCVLLQPGEDLEVVAKELADVQRSPYLLLNLQRLYKILTDIKDRGE